MIICRVTAVTNVTQSGENGEADEQEAEEGVSMAQQQQPAPTATSPPVSRRPLAVITCMLTTNESQDTAWAMTDESAFVHET